MKNTAVLSILAAASAVVALPSVDIAKRDSCTFGTYQCAADNTGIELCAIEQEWELVGPCPAGTSCELLPQNPSDLPFCTTTVAQDKRGAHPAGWCATPGQYTCDGANAIQVCNTTYGLQKVGNCPNGSHCSYINNIPFCVD